MPQIRLDPTRVRSHEDPEKQLELARSMKEKGLLNPISVREMSNGTFEIIAGNRRFLAAQSLGWTEIDARVWPESTSPTETELLALVDNLQRDDFNSIDEAKAFYALTQPPHGKSQEEIAQAVGKSQPVIANALTLLSLPEEVQEFISREILSPGHARFLSRIGDKREIVRVAKVASSQGWSIRELERRVNAKLQKAAPAPKIEAEEVDPLSALWSVAASEVSVPDGQWNVRYEKGRRWSFTVQAPAKNPASAIASWAGSLMKALQRPEAKAVENAPKLAAFTQKMIADSVNAPPDQVADDISKVRRPSSDAEWSSFLAAVKEGPASMYRWMYGPKSEMAANAEGLTWKDMGVTDPESLAREMVAAIGV
jgi:ParB family chromosome partitioning protein